MKLVTREQMNLIDYEASATFQIPSLVLMEHAGHGVFKQLQARYAKGTRFCFVCGHGNNGGDGFVCARLLHQSGYEATIYFVGELDKLTADAKTNFKIAKSLDVAMVNTLVGYDVVVDCLFGTGLQRPIENQYKVIVEAINDAQATVISMDIPSGIDSNNGQILGCAVTADLTFTMQCGKVGMYIYPGRLHCGNIEIIDIHLPQFLIDTCDSKMYLVEKSDMQQLLPKRGVHSNKGSYGKVLCIGGSTAMSGAISLASLSALRSGCGLMTCAIPQSIHEIVATNVLESMNIALPETAGMINAEAVAIIAAQLDRYSTVLIGCGIGRNEDIIAMMDMLLASDIHLVVDADGLVALKTLLDKYPNRDNIIITPHLKEFADLMDKDVAAVMQDPLRYIDMFTQRYPNYTLVLKSETTIIAKYDTRYFNVYGNNGLAVGGSGDVLAGITTGLYAQNKNTLHASVLAVFLHAYCADTLLSEKSVYSILPSDIIETLATIMKVLSEESE